MGYELTESMCFLLLLMRVVSTVGDVLSSISALSKTAAEIESVNVIVHHGKTEA